MPLFSVIIPTYNRAELLRETIESVWAQRFTDYEMIVVDDGSTDQTLALLAKWGERIRVIRQENAGPAAARNRGIDVAAGEYCAFLDSDDLWFPWTLQIYAQAIQQAGEVSGIIATPFHFKELIQVANVQECPLRLTRYDNYLAIATLDMYRGSGVSAWKTSVLVAAGGFVEEEMYGEDLELFLRLGTAPGLVHIESPPAVAVRQHAQGSLGRLDRHCRGAAEMIRREHARAYPGGMKWASARRASIVSYALVISLMCLEQRRYRWGLLLYARMFRLALLQRKFKFLIGWPLAVFFPMISPLRRPQSLRAVNVAQAVEA